ncbi:Prokaryotic N-terminal methylation motif domain protein [gamma proteobacterium NOR5-3]|nr:Prokaryotic N-terminal methylation motif domain protein [gamma proteobacterium NOR5-3]
MREASGAETGFTIAELLVALAVLSILISMGTPALSELRQKAESTRVVQHTLTLLNYARSEAVMSGLDVTLCGTDETGRCQRDWRQAASVDIFIDANRNKRHDHPETILRTSTLPTELGVMKWRASLARSYITFDASGFTWQNGTLTFCPKNGNPRDAYAVVISQTGRSYLTGDRDNDGIREDRSGKPLNC